MLDPLDDNLWSVGGPDVVAALGFSYPTRMIVARLPDGGLWVHSPIRLTDDLRAALAGVGPVAHILAPNALHDTWLADWATAFPGAAVWTAPGVAGPERAQVVETAPAVWQGVFDMVLFPTRLARELVPFHRPSGTILFTDLVQHLSPRRYRGWRSVVARLDGMTAPAPRVPRKFRLATAPRDDARAALRVMLGWPVTRMTMAHGPVTPQPDLAALFDWL